MLSTKGKIVSKYCNISKTPRRGSIPPLVPWWGMNLRVRSRVKTRYLLMIERLEFPGKAVLLPMVHL